MTDARDALRAYEMQPQHAYAGRSRGHSAPRAFAALRSLLDLADNLDVIAEFMSHEAATENRKSAHGIRRIVKEALSDD